jgi:hypothetical protein
MARRGLVPTAQRLDEVRGVFRLELGRFVLRGGAIGCTLDNCTLTGNSASRYGGGASGGTLNNCIVYSNAAPIGPNYCDVGNEWEWGPSPILLNYCCTTPLPMNGFGNIDADPLFVDYAGGSLRLQADSPCINAGNNDYVTTSIDLDGNPRISGGVVDMGAYEFVFTPSMEIARLITLVSDSDLPANRKQPLLATPSAALASIKRGNSVAATNQLRAFQNKVQAQVTYPVLAREFMEAAQRVIDALSSSGPDSWTRRYSAFLALDSECGPGDAQVHRANGKFPRSQPEPRKYFSTTDQKDQKCHFFFKLTAYRFPDRIAFPLGDVEGRYLWAKKANQSIRLV